MFSRPLAGNAGNTRLKGDLRNNAAQSDANALAMSRCQASAYRFLGDAPATEVARPSPHAGAGRIGAPPPARVRLMRPRTMIRLAALNVAPTRNAGV